MLPSDPLLSLWTSYGRRGAREEMGAPGPASSPGSRAAPASAGRRCWERLPAGALDCFSLLRSPSLPLLSSPPQWTGGPGALAARTQRFVQVRAMQRRAAGWDGPSRRFASSPSSPPPSPTTPTNFPVLPAPPVSYLGISCLNSSFCLLHFKRSLL